MADIIVHKIGNEVISSCQAWQKRYSKEMDRGDYEPFRIWPLKNSVHDFLIKDMDMKSQIRINFTKGQDFKGIL